MNGSLMPQPIALFSGSKLLSPRLPKQSMNGSLMPQPMAFLAGFTTTGTAARFPRQSIKGSLMSQPIARFSASKLPRSETHQKIYHLQTYREQPKLALPVKCKTTMGDSYLKFF